MRTAMMMDLVNIEATYGWRNAGFDVFVGARVFPAEITADLLAKRTEGHKNSHTQVVFVFCRDLATVVGSIEAYNLQGDLFRVRFQFHHLTELSRLSLGAHRCRVSRVIPTCVLAAPIVCGRHKRKLLQDCGDAPDVVRVEMAHEDVVDLANAELL